MNNHTMPLDLHRNDFAGQDSTDNQHQLVKITLCSAFDYR